MPVLPLRVACVIIETKRSGTKIQCLPLQLVFLVLGFSLHALACLSMVCHPQHTGSTRKQLYHLFFLPYYTLFPSLVQGVRGFPRSGSTRIDPGGESGGEGLHFLRGRGQSGATVSSSATSRSRICTPPSTSSSSSTTTPGWRCESPSGGFPGSSASFRSTCRPSARVGFLLNRVNLLGHS